MVSVSANSMTGLLTGALMVLGLTLSGQVTVTGQAFAEIVEMSEIASSADSYVSVDKQDAGKTFDMGECLMNGSANSCISVTCDFTDFKDIDGNAAPNGLDFYDQSRDITLDGRGSHVFKIQANLDADLSESSESQYSGEYKVTFLYN